MAKYKGKPTEKKKTAQEIQEEIYEMEQQKYRQEEERKEAILKTIKFQPGIKLKNEKQKELIKKIHENEIIFVSGSAGTGKTFISLKAALECLYQQSEKFKKILITKPIIEAGGESLGFLPGGIDSKIDPYMHSFESNFKDLIGPVQFKTLMENEIIKTVPLPYMRGNTFKNCIAILDEAQNTTPKGMKLFISRKGGTAKLIVLGDTDQSDLELRKGEISGLQDAFSRFKDIPKVAFIEFTEDDIVRDDLLIHIMKRYKNQ
jgi:phosphate starvation-inducible PhoH-like protein